MQVYIVVSAISYRIISKRYRYWYRLSHGSRWGDRSRRIRNLYEEQDGGVVLTCIHFSFQSVSAVLNF